jgi:pSer/pThr/pTyr-binding forkhead associated (FHA) protein
MPLLAFGVERHALRAGTYAIGGSGPNALLLPAFEALPEVAMIVVPTSGASTIQRVNASVVVRVNQVPIGIAPKALADGVEIDFNGYRLIFRTDDAGGAALTSASTDDAPDDERLIPDSVALPGESTRHAINARIVNVRTGNAIDLGACRIVVGRDKACDLVVRAMGASRRHCSITPVQDGYVLRDESANGTSVNGSRVAGTYLLGHGDIVRVADEELRFEVEGGAAPTPSPTTAPIAIPDVSDLRAEHGTAGTSDRPRATMVANLEIVRGPYSGASFSIDRPVCTIGRGPENDVRIREDSISTNHATLLRKGSAWFVVDLRSANGTLVDGLRIAAERELTSGSRLKLGRVELMFRALDGGAEVSVAPTPLRSRWLERFTALFARRSQVPSQNV